MGKHICQWYLRQGPDLQNIERTHTYALQEDKQPNYKMGKGLEQTLLQGRHTECPETYEKMLSITSHQRDAHLNHNEVPSHTSQSGQNKQIHKQMLERMRRKGNPSALLVGMQTGEATVENSMEFPQKTKNGPALWPSNSAAGIIP